MMDIDRDIVNTVVELFNVAFNYDGNVFGIYHNTAADTINTLENLLEETK